MAEVLPNSRRQTIEWFESRISTWAKDPGAIGLTSETVAELSARLDEARAAMIAASALRQSSLAATGIFHSKTDTMRQLGADLIKMVRAFALASDDHGVFAAALIPPPADPAPVGPPAMPTDIAAAIYNTGDIKITWKGRRAHGTQFIIERQMSPIDGPPGPFIWVGHSTGNDFTDTAVPVGFLSAGYRVHAIRPGGTSDASNTATVYFGTPNAGAGETAASTLAA